MNVPPTSDTGRAGVLVAMVTMVWLGAAALAGDDVPLEAVSVEVDVSGPLAELVLRQTFRNVTSSFVDATYTFPLDNDAVVDGMILRVGDRTVRSTVLARDEARETWAAAAAAGQVAALTEQHRPNVFGQEVANLPPGEAIEVELRIVQPVDRADGAWELVLPLVVAPRFVRPQDVGSDEVAALDVVPASLVLDDATGPRADLAVAVHATAPIHGMSSPSHAPQLAVDGLEATASVDDVPLDRDFVLRWRTDADLPQLGVLKADGHALLMMEVPREVPYGARAAREIVWVLDTSCSMAGDKIALARNALIGALDTMDARDSFAVLGFGNEVDEAFYAPVPASPENVERARAFVRDLEAHGGTWMDLALHESLAFPDDPARRRMVVFVTDGQIGFDAELLGKIAQAADQTTFVALGIGGAPNRYLLDEMARLGGGVAAYGVVPEDLEDLVRTMDRPALSDVRIDWGDCDPELVSPAAVPTLRPGHPVHLLARVRGPCTERVRVVAWGDRVAEFDLAVREVPRGRALASTWARARVADLERQAMRGAVDDPAPAIEALGLEYGIVTAQTSMVAVDDRVLDPSGQAVPSRVPAGESHGTLLNQEFVHRIPSGRTYSSAVQTVPGIGSGGNPNMAGGASNENTYLLDGVNVSDPVSGAMMVVNRDAVSHPPRPVIGRMPEGADRFARIPDGLSAELRALGSGAGVDPLLGGRAHAAMRGNVADGVYAELAGDLEQATLGEATVRRGALAGHVDALPGGGVLLRAAGRAAPGAVVAGGRLVPMSDYTADLGVDVVGVAVGAGWARRSLAAGLRDRLDADLRVRLPGGEHRPAVGFGVTQTAWSVAGRAPRVTTIGGFVQDAWPVRPWLHLSGGLRVDALTAPTRTLPSPRLLAVVRPDHSDDTRLLVGWDVVRDLDRLLPLGAAEVRLPVDSTASVRAERQLVAPVRVALTAAWSRQRFAFTGAPVVTLLPTDAAEVARDVATAGAGVDLSLGARSTLALAYRFAHVAQDADPALLADAMAPFVPGYLAALRPHALTADLRVDLAPLWITLSGRWASAVPGAAGGWWTRDEVVAGLDVRRRFGPVALFGAVTAARNALNASIVPVEAYGAGVALPAVGDQPTARAHLGLEVAF